MIQVELTGLGQPANVYVERIDHDHANAKRLWVEMGNPALPTPRQVEQLHAASKLMRDPLKWKYGHKTLGLKISMPAHSVAAITVELTRK